MYIAAISYVGIDIDFI